MKRYLLALILLALPGIASSAQAKKPKIAAPTMVPTSDATLRALAAVIADSKSRQTQLEVRATAVRQQLAALKGKVKNPKIDIAEQLSKDDLDTYNVLNGQLRYLENESLVETIRQKDLTITKDIYRASFFVATEMSEYVEDKNGLDDDFEEYCQAKAKGYGMDTPVALLLNAQDYITDNGIEK